MKYGSWQTSDLYVLLRNELNKGTRGNKAHNYKVKGKKKYKERMIL